MKTESEKLTLVELGNYCLLANKYQDKIAEAGIPNDVEGNKEFLRECSEMVSEQLRIMNTCQKILYQQGYKEESVEEMKRVRDTFKKGVETMQQVLDAFCIVTNE